MHAAAEAQEYEEAAACRDQIRSLKAIRERQFVSDAKAQDADVIAAVDAEAKRRGWLTE
jgi:excinuclease ABC subunit C